MIIIILLGDIGYGRWSSTSQIMKKVVLATKFVVNRSVLCISYIKQDARRMKIASQPSGSST